MAAYITPDPQRIVASNVMDLVRGAGVTLKRVANTKGGEYHGPCPWCGGTDRFHVWPEQNDGHGSYWCRQCEKTGDNIQFLRDFHGMSYEDALSFLGLPTNKQGKDLPAGIYENWKGYAFTAFWTYRLKEQVTGYAVRYEQKNGEKVVIPFFKHNGTEWKAGAPKQPAHLYNIDALEKRPEDPVWIAEGEKCVDALATTGRLAVTSQGGSGAARKTDWRPLSGREVIIWPDNDAAGKKYFKSVVSILERLSPSPKIKVVDISGLNLPEGGDVVDWLKDHDADELDSLPISKIERKAGEAEGKDLPRAKRLKVASLEDFILMELPPAKNLMDPWLPEQGLAMIYAKPGVGKTLLALNVAYAIAAGVPFLKWTVPEPAGVLYVDGEMRAVTMQERLMEIVKAVNKPAVKPFKIYNPGIQDPDSMILPDLSTRKGQRLIDEHIDQNTKLVILDNISCLCRTGEENKTESWRHVQEWLLKWKALGKTFLLIHHAGKTGMQRGTSARIDQLDTVMKLREVEGRGFKTGANFRIDFKDKARDFFGEEKRPFEVSLKDGIWTMKTIEESTFEQVVNLANAGLSKTEIAKQLNIHKSTAGRHYRSAKEKGLIHPVDVDNISGISP